MSNSTILYLFSRVGDRRFGSESWRRSEEMRLRFDSESYVIEIDQQSEPMATK